ncbi:response regulator [Bdellovibrio sp. HCB337]|uniref:response regulator n=1 Tax=Bdellovibrio sp. HCB337 TaxID=3394358 RepID=UPI0039A7148A
MDLKIPPVDILIVDDRLDGLIALEAVLTLPNINLVRAQSGKEALELLTRYEFAVILLDVQMPEMDGFETARHIRSTEKYRYTPIIFVTAINKDDSHIYRGYEVGAVDYIFKPFEPQILRSKVGIFVDLFLKSRQLQEQNALIRDSERQTRYLQLAQLEMETLKRYRNLADAVPNMIWKSKVDGTLDYFNKVWADYTGLSSEQSVGSGWQEAIHPSDLRGFLKAWMDSMNSGDPFQIECRIRRHDGEVRWHWVRAVPELNTLDKVVAWIGTCTDIHDRKLAEKLLVEAKTMAVSANIAKTQFLANMSHEIRTPLSAILGFAELLLNPDLNYEERVQSINTICRSGEQLLKLIDEILDISKVEAGHLDIEQIEVDMAGLLSDLKTLLGIKSQTKGIGLEFILNNAIPKRVTSDPTRLRQILLNMISNAIKFTQKGTVKLEIGWEEATKSFRFRVRDTGVGISQEQAEKLFQPFVQVDSSTTRRFGGTGLGLALSRTLAQAMGGNVYLENSKAGVGSSFIIEVHTEPLDGTAYLDKIEDILRVDQKPLVSEEVASLEGIKVLLVEDAPINQILIGRFLTGAGAQVDFADNGLEGVKKAMSGDYGVVLMDIQMPEMDGYEATTTLRKQGYSRPIIALTAHALKEDRDRCLQVGCSDHLTKPIDRKRLISQISHLSQH